MNARWLSVVAVCVACTAGPARPAAESCVPLGKPLALPDVREASGIAVGRLPWLINDSGNPPLLYALDAAGMTSRVTLTGANLIDWEDLSIGRCGATDCLYIADIGDNRTSRDRVTIYRVPEPAAGSASTMPADAFHLTYPDHPHDAEAFVVVPGRVQELFIITKDERPEVYRLARQLEPGRSSALSFVRVLGVREPITGAAASHDGRWIALRSNRTLFIYPSQGFATDANPVSVDLTSLDEPQGEGVAFDRSGELYLVSESGDVDGGAGVLTRLRCDFIR